MFKIRQNKTQLLITFYFSILLLLAPFAIQSLDTYYYWDWSRHLALSYFDGSPMIAYFIKLSTLVWGDTRFALSFVGILITAIMARIIYKSARLFLDKESSTIAMLLWLVSPLVTLTLLKQTTYDAPLNLFWACTVYFALKYIKFNKIIDLYLIGSCIGLMLLSKYAGIVLILCFLIFLIITKYRHLFKTQHLYWSALLSLVIFSPVLIWNYQHDWQSFTYQLSTHKYPELTNPVVNSIQAFFIIILPSLNFMLLPFVICWKHQDAKQYNNEVTNLILTLCKTICLVTFCFYLYLASDSHIRETWLTPYLISSALLAGYCYQRFHYYKFFKILIFAYFILSLGIVISSTPIGLKPSKKNAYYHLIQQLNAKYPNLDEIILTSGWWEARPFFFLNGKHQVYTLGCYEPQNQYSEWSISVKKMIKNREIQKFVYLDDKERTACLKDYFDSCELLDKFTYKNSRHELFMYKCFNKK